MNDGHFETIIFAYVAPIDYFRNRIDMPNAMKQHLYGLLLTTVLLTGCTHRNPIAETLTYAGEQLKTDPDDALHILRDIAPEALGSRAERARYALLYAEAAERSADTVDSARSDSLLRMAWDYYRERPQEVRNQCRTRYYQARNKLRQGDKPGALRLFLERDLGVEAETADAEACLMEHALSADTMGRLISYLERQGIVVPE